MGRHRHPDHGTHAGHQRRSTSTVSRQYVAELANRLADARLTTIEAGHLVHETLPDQYLRTLIAFLIE